jgi:hypothetical protein
MYHIFITFLGLTQLEDSFRFDQRYDDYYVPLLKKYGRIQKFVSVFGSNPIIWLLPISKYISN